MLNPIKNKDIPSKAKINQPQSNELFCFKNQYNITSIWKFINWLYVKIIIEKYKNTIIDQKRDTLLTLLILNLSIKEIFIIAKQGNKNKIFRNINEKVNYLMIILLS